MKEEEKMKRNKRKYILTKQVKKRRKRNENIGTELIFTEKKNVKKEREVVLERSRGKTKEKR